MLPGCYDTIIVYRYDGESCGTASPAVIARSEATKQSGAGRTIPLAPFLEGRGKRKEGRKFMEGHPPCLPPKGLRPSGLPACGGCDSIVAGTIPLAPLISRKGGQ